MVDWKDVFRAPVSALAPRVWIAGGPGAAVAVLAGAGVPAVGWNWMTGLVAVGGALGWMWAAGAVAKDTLELARGNSLAAPWSAAVFALRLWPVWCALLVPPVVVWSGVFLLARAGAALGEVSVPLGGVVGGVLVYAAAVLAWPAVAVLFAVLTLGPPLAVSSRSGKACLLVVAELIAALAARPLWICGAALVGVVLAVGSAGATWLAARLILGALGGPGSGGPGLAAGISAQALFTLAVASTHLHLGGGEPTVDGGAGGDGGGWDDQGMPFRFRQDWNPARES